MFSQRVREEKSPGRTFLLVARDVITCTAMVASVGMAIGNPASATNPGDPVLRDVEVRSFLGEHLNLRIALAASTETVSNAICQSVIDSDRRESALRSADLILSMVELRTARYLQVRSRAPYNEPVALFSLRIGCPGEPIVDREFTVLLDPPPFTAAPILPTSEAAIDPIATSTEIAAAGKSSKVARSAPRAKPVVPAAGNWAVREGDTLSALAKGIHPKNRARQQQYVATLRNLNPAVEAIADDAPLAVGSQLALPDLLTLSGILPANEIPARRAAPPAVPKQSTPKRAPKAAAVPRGSTAETRPAPQPSAPVAVTPPPVKTVEPVKASPPKPAPPAVKAPPMAVPTAKPAPRADGFQLRLSGSEMDLSRSRNITDEQRRQLREKHLMLDADDQVAALLSLKNTVKQLEQRLNEIQLKQAASTVAPTAPMAATATKSTPTAAMPVAATPPAVAPTNALPAATSTIIPPSAATSLPASSPSDAQKQPPAPVKAMPAPSAPAKSAGEGQNNAAAQASVSKSAAVDAPGVDLLENLLPSPLVTGGIAGGLALLFGAWFWSRRGKTPARAPSPAQPSRAERSPSRVEEHDQAIRADVAPSATPSIDNTAQPEPADASLQTTRNLVVDAAPAAPDQYSQFDAPVVFDDAPARFEVDARPATTVDFLVGMDEQLPEDRVRRLQYMHERYPELQSNTVSIDDADSVINTARLYYDEADTVGHDKASELLTFAVEERPQEIRFWLAQFEIFRLENMAEEFTELAGKFHVLFSHTPAWPKVRHIGHELAPGNPLFAASGSPLLAGETRFDPIAENWLNAPMDFTSDALMSDLRLALLDDHRVDRADFDSIAARLSVSAVHA